MNIIIKKSASERMQDQAHVASPYQLEKLQEQIHEIESLLKNKGLEKPDGILESRDFNTAGHEKDLNNLKEGVDKNAPRSLSGKERDEYKRKMTEIQEQFREKAPRKQEMDTLSARNVDKNRKWLDRKHKFGFGEITGQQAEYEYNKMRRTLGEDPFESQLENFRRD